MSKGKLGLKVETAVSFRSIKNPKPKDKKNEKQDK